MLRQGAAEPGVEANADFVLVVVVVADVAAEAGVGVEAGIPEWAGPSQRA